MKHTPNCNISEKLSDVCSCGASDELTIAICGAKPMPDGDATGCEHKNQDSGFGLAGGGYGVYMYCTDCGFITSKTQTE